jgi:hypothetical protein
MLEERNIKYGGGQIKIRVDSLANMNTGGVLVNLERRQISEVSQKIKKFFEKYYKKKGFWLRDAKIRQLTSFYNEISFEVTDLKNEAIRDGYFEYHYVRVKIFQEGGDVHVIWTFQGKYGSGIFFPPRKPKDYKDMELKPEYKEDLERYEENLFRLLEEQLRK